MVMLSNEKGGMEGRLVCRYGVYERRILMLMINWGSLTPPLQITTTHVHLRKGFLQGSKKRERARDWDWEPNKIEQQKEGRGLLVDMTYGSH